MAIRKPSKANRGNACHKASFFFLPASVRRYAAKATAQSTYEIAIAYGEEGFSVATAGADQTAAIAIADAELVAANAKALAISNLGLAGNYTAHPPTVPEAPDLGSAYAVAAAPAHHYWVTSQFYWYYGMWGYAPYGLGLGYWGGYYDYGYSGLGMGMGGMYYGGYNYVPPAPEVRLESSFWNISSHKFDVLRMGSPIKASVK